MSGDVDKSLRDRWVEAASLWLSTKEKMMSTTTDEARLQVDLWVKACSEVTRVALSGHELDALRQMAQICIDQDPLGREEASPAPEPATLATIGVMEGLSPARAELCRAYNNLRKELPGGTLPNGALRRLSTAIDTVVYQEEYPNPAPKVEELGPIRRELHDAFADVQVEYNAHIGPSRLLGRLKDAIRATMHREEVEAPAKVTTKIWLGDSDTDHSHWYWGNDSWTACDVLDYGALFVSTLEKPTGRLTLLKACYTGADLDE